MSILPFYGAENREMFAIERAAMDRPGKVRDYLSAALPNGLLLDVGAGDGFTAEGLTMPGRRIVGVEPARGMMNTHRRVEFVQGSAEQLPFPNRTFDGAYATWAYFFPGHLDVTPGLAELHRVVRPGGPLLIADNLGGDEFSALLEQPAASDARFWEAHGFSVDVIDTVFEFSNEAEANRLMSFYVGREITDVPRVIDFRVAVMSGTSRGTASRSDPGGIDEREGSIDHTRGIHG